jgi:hypothetical protein
MGVKYEGGDIFDAALNGLMSCPGVTPEMIRKTAEPLIRELLAFGWNNPEGTLGMHAEDPDESDEVNAAIVAAFRANSILLFCGAEHPDDGEPCEGDGMERGHLGQHKDHLGRAWTEEESVK